MFKRKFLALAIEDALETEKILKSSEVAASGGDFGSLRDQLSSKLDTMIEQRDNPVESTSSSSSYDSSDSSSDSGEDTESAEDSGDDINFDMGDDSAEEEDPPADENKDSSKDDTEKDDTKDKSASDKKEKDKEATEHASLYLANTEDSLDKEFKLIDASIAKEELTLGEKIWEGAKALGGIAYSVVNALAYIGVNILAPAIKHLYKGVLYLSAKFIRYSHAAITKIDAEAESFINRISKTKEEIEAAKEVIALIKKKQEEFPNSVSEVVNTFNRPKVIGRIKLGNETSPIKNAAVIEVFLTKWYGKISSDIEKDSAAIKQVLHYGIHSSINPVKVFGDSSMRNGLIHDPKKTIDETNGFVSAMRYPATLPGNLYYCCAVPNGKAQSLEDIRMAYAASSASFSIDTSTYVKIEHVDYMDLNGVEKSIEAIERLVDTLEKQKDIYKAIKNEKVMYLNSFKRYLYKLADESERISIEKSMLEYVYLRNVYIDSVYSLTARDIHEYTHKYLANVMIYLRSNLEELSS